MTTALDLVTEAKKAINEVDAQTFKNSSTDERIVIDVREPAEYEQGHLDNAVNIPRGILEFDIMNNSSVKQQLQDPSQLKSSPIYLYCQSGGRSALAAESLQKLGFSKVVSIAGGYKALTESK